MTETFFVTTLDNFGETFKRVWLSEAEAMKPASGHIDVYLKSELIRVNMGLTNDLTPDAMRRYAMLFEYAAGLIDSTGEH